MTGRQERRWAWYAQVVDAAFALAGLGLLVDMVVKDKWPLPELFLVLVFAGRVTSSTVQRWLIERWNGVGKP